MRAREIKFRGKTAEGRWIPGSLVTDAWHNKCRIYNPISDTFKDIVPETAVQFTGLYDKYNREIYEDDVVEFVYSPKRLHEKHIGVVEFYDNTHWALRDVLSGAEFHIENAVKRGTVIGNIHDNPEFDDPEY